MQVDTGKVLYNVSTSNWNLETLNYDAKTGLMFGIGLQAFGNGSASRTLLRYFLKIISVFSASMLPQEPMN